MNRRTKLKDVAFRNPNGRLCSTLECRNASQDLRLGFHGKNCGPPPYRQIGGHVHLEPVSGEERFKVFLCDLRRTNTAPPVRITKCWWKIEQDYHQLKEGLAWIITKEGVGTAGTSRDLGDAGAHSFLTWKLCAVKKTLGGPCQGLRREIQYLLFTWTGNCAYCGVAVDHSQARST